MSDSEDEYIAPPHARMRRAPAPAPDRLLPGGDGDGHPGHAGDGVIGGGVIGGGGGGGGGGDAVAALNLELIAARPSGALQEALVSR